MSSSSTPSTATTTTRLTRDEYKQRKALEEARKAGTALPEVDETGRDINPHIPEYIAKAPWYISTGKPTLSHQKSTLRSTSTDSQSLLSQEYLQIHNNNQHEQQQQNRQKTTQKKVITKYVKGACENCGSTSHQTRDCLERPRRRGAKLTGKSFVTEHFSDNPQNNNSQSHNSPNNQGHQQTSYPNMSFDSKRDRWRGYDSSQYDSVFQYHRQLDLERKKRKAAELARQQLENMNKGSTTIDSTKHTSDNHHFSDSDSDSEREDCEDRENLDQATNQVLFSNSDPRTKSTIRNLRIREDTAKYLLNLDEGSAHYDPKTRSMRANPTPHLDPSEIVYAGDNVLRKTGEWRNFASLQMYALQAQNHGQNDVNVVGAPSLVELSYKNFEQKKKVLTEMQKHEILSEYGGEEYLRRAEDDAALSLNEKRVLVQYGRDGKVIHEPVNNKSNKQNGKSLGENGTNRMKSSRYMEDVFELGHASVWGSYWHDGQWGYACCKVMNRTTPCPNEDLLDVAGIATVEDVNTVSVGSSSSTSASASSSKDGGSSSSASSSAKKRKLENDGDAGDSRSSSSDSDHDGDSDKKKKKKKKVRRHQSDNDDEES